jgi:hypothetical protein
MKRHRFVVFLSVAAAVVAVLVPTAARAAFEQTFSQKGVAAAAGWEFCEPDTPTQGVTTCTRIFLFAFQGTEKGTDVEAFKGTRVCLTVETISFREHGQGPDPTNAIEGGCTAAPEGTLSVPRDLSAAELQATAVTIACSEGDCEPGSTRQVTVSAGWTAVGPLEAIREHDRFIIDDCTEMVFVKRERRDAVATGTLDSAALDSTTFADITDGTLTTKSTCPTP